MKSRSQIRDESQREGSLGKNEERAKVTIFYNKMEETDQLGLEPVVKLTRESTAISYDLAKQIPLLTSSNEIWTDAVRTYFNSETLGFFDYSFRDHGKIENVFFAFSQLYS